MPIGPTDRNTKRRDETIEARVAEIRRITEERDVIVSERLNICDGLLGSISEKYASRLADYRRVMKEIGGGDVNSLPDAFDGFDIKKSITREAGTGSDGEFHVTGVYTGGSTILDARSIYGRDVKSITKAEFDADVLKMAGEIESFFATIDEKVGKMLDYAIASEFASAQRDLDRLRGE